MSRVIVVMTLFPYPGEELCDVQAHWIVVLPSSGKPHPPSLFQLLPLKRIILVVVGKMYRRPLHLNHWDRAGTASGR